MLQTKRETIAVVPEIDSLNRIAKVKKNSHSRRFNFSSSMMPAYFFSRAFGLLPFSIVRDSRGEAQAARVYLLDFLWFFISMLIYFLLTIYVYFDVESLGPSQTISESYILIVGEPALIIFGMIYGAMVIVMDMLNRNRLVDVLKKFTDFDKEVNCSIFFPFKIH